MAGDGFSELLGQLKERSGLSYGSLGKRLHTSASTLHRYVNGDAVPADYAPVERFARVCRATPEELVELHRRWVLADARRRQRGTGTGEAAATEATAATRETEAGAADVGSTDAGSTDAGSATAETAPDGSAGADRAGEPAGADDGAGADGGAGAPEPDSDAVPDSDAEPDADAESGAAPRAARRRRLAVLAGGSVAAVVLSAALLASLLPGDADGEGTETGGEGVAADSTASDDAGAASTGTDTGADDEPSGSASASDSGDPDPDPDQDQADPAGGGSGGGAEAGEVAAPTVATDPYDWPDACQAHYLVDQEPDQVPPPPYKDTARGWVTALGGVAAGTQWLRLTVQGTGEDTVVLEDLTVRVVDRETPLAWNDYVMGTDGCGGPVESRHFGVDLDAGQPEVTPRGGQRDFPYSVSEADPEVYYLTVTTEEYDVSWYLELEWSSGGQTGTVRIDDDGQPFRLSANEDRPAYDYPLGYNDRWEVNDGLPGAPTSDAQD